jgi:hypothetical protein
LMLSKPWKLVTTVGKIFFELKNLENPKGILKNIADFFWWLHKHEKNFYVAKKS